MLAGTERRFPHRTFVDLTVAHDDEHAAVALLHSRRKRHADTNGKTVPQRAGRSFDARNLAALRMTAKYPVDPAEPVEFFGGEETFVDKESVERETSVPLAQDAPISLVPGWIFRIEAENVV